MAEEVIVFEGVTSGGTVLKRLKLSFGGFTIVKLVMVTGAKIDSDH